MRPTREWFTAAELAALGLPDLPATRQGVQAKAEADGWQNPEKEGVQWRRRHGRGGGIEFHACILPMAAQIKLTLLFGSAVEVEQDKAASRQAELWARFERLPEKAKETARTRLQALQAVEALVQNGVLRTVAGPTVARRFGVGLSSLYRWREQVGGLFERDWLPALAPQYHGNEASAEIAPEAWDFVRTDYLRLEKPSFAACYRRLQAAGAERGWAVPSQRTVLRRIEAMPEALRVLAREGQDALRRLYPAQQRTRAHFSALQAVNADGHKWDVFVKWPDGYVGRPMMCGFQDLYSGKILAWRIDKSASAEAVRLTIGDMMEQWGIPDDCWLDNGRDFASKWITGGTPNRYRFRVREDEPQGLLTQLGVRVHWTTPYAGQSKPIERAWRDLAMDGAKHPRFAGAYTGNKVTAKPANYGAAAVPLDVFLETVGEIIAEHNSRKGRRSAVCQGRSFDEVFAESYARAPIRKATPEQRRLWLLAAEAIRVSPTDGTITLLGNRFHADFLYELRGKRVTVRFDPQELQEDLQVYSAAGAYLGAAPCIAAVGFDDIDKAREHARNRKAFMRGTAAALAAEKRMTLAEVADALPHVGGDRPAADAKLVRPVFGTHGSAALKPRESTEAARAAAEDEVLAGLRLIRFPHGLSE